jgi:hypothetical protein
MWEGNSLLIGESAFCGQNIYWPDIERPIEYKAI